MTPSSVSPINIIIVDDHKIFLEGLYALLKDIPSLNIVACYTSGKQVLDNLKSNFVDIVITDIDMPEIDGFILTKDIKKQFPSTKVIALTMHNEAKVISDMFKAGVTSYLLKDTGKDELLEAIVTSHKGDRFISKELQSKLINDITISSKERQKQASQIELSDRELEVLKLIAEENTQQQIADKLFISPHTVVFHRRNLLLKLDVKNTAGLIRKAIDMRLI